MNNSAVAKLLKGRTIVRVELNAFRDDVVRESKWTADPVFVLDDGSSVGFGVRETENGRYGIDLIHHDGLKKS